MEVRSRLILNPGSSPGLVVGRGSKNAANNRSGVTQLYVRTLLRNDTPAGVLVEGATRLGCGPLKGAVSAQKTLQESENDTNYASKIPLQIPLIFYKKSHGN